MKVHAFGYPEFPVGHCCFVLATTNYRWSELWVTRFREIFKKHSKVFTKFQKKGLTFRYFKKNLIRFYKLFSNRSSLAK